MDQATLGALRDGGTPEPGLGGCVQGFAPGQWKRTPAAGAVRVSALSESASPAMLRGGGLSRWRCHLGESSLPPFLSASVYSSLEGPPNHTQR